MVFRRPFFLASSHLRTCIMVVKKVINKLKLLQLSISFCNIIVVVLMYLTSKALGRDGKESIKFLRFVIRDPFLV